MLLMESNHHVLSRDAATEAVASFIPVAVRPRMDGWTPERRRLFRETLADCGLVRDAAAAVGISTQSAYQLRRRASGRAFAIAWDAALYLARQRLIDMALERAIDGNIETVVKDGKVLGEKSKKDVRHLLATITKLETSQMGNPVARTVAGEFEEFLDCMESDANRAFAVAATPDGKAGQPEQNATRQTTQFLAAREPDSRSDRKSHEAALDRLSSGENYARRDPFERMAEGFTQENLDDWDEIMEWEAGDRAAGGVQPIPDALSAALKTAQQL